MDLTVGQAAARLGVTVRALHHWDEIGLAAPSARSYSGYRMYAPQDVERLQRIVVYRELGLPLDDIRTILDDPDADPVTTLRIQREQLAERIARLTALDADLSRMIDAHERGLPLSAEEQKEALGPEWDTDWPLQARERYGDSLEWRLYAERSASRSAADWAAIAEVARAFDRSLADAMDAGVEPGSPEGNALVDRHRDEFSAYFPITREMQVVLGRMFEADAAYAGHYDDIRPGLAAWFRRLIDAEAHAHGVNPDAATWR